MTGKSHLVCGIFGGLTYGVISGDFSSSVLIPTIITSAIGGLTPDIDSPNSKIGRKIKPISWLANRLCGHRGLIHTPFFVAIVSCLILTLMFISNNINNYYLLISFVIGYTGHLLLDTFTVEGIMWLYPFNKKKIHFTNIKTGSIFEYLISIICIPIVCLLVISFLA